MIIEMRKRNRTRGGIGKERAIMLAASVFVLSALTLTGVYVRENNVEQNDDGFSIDLSSLENSVNNTGNEQAQANAEEPDDSLSVQNPNAEYELDLEAVLEEGELDNLELTKTTKGEEDGKKETKPDAAPKQETSGSEAQGAKDDAGAAAQAENISQDAPVEVSQDVPQDAPLEAAGNEALADENASVATTTWQALEFKEEAGLVWPTVGEILINYSMDKTVYFPTLAQYKYNPAIIIEASEGKTIVAAADAQIIDIYKDDEIGNAVKMDLGNGYELIYGQLTDIQISKGAYVSAGDVIGTVGTPTKYYSVEGSNLYVKLSKDGTPINPLTLLPQ